MTHSAEFMEGIQRQNKILQLLNRTNYDLVQINGQRRYGGPPPKWKGPRPPKGSEVFVGKIPRDCMEDELVPVFEKIGIIYEMRLMMDFSGSNRGYAFVMFTNQKDAAKAVEELNNYEIREGKPLGVVRSVDNCRLFVGGLPRNKTREEVEEEMRRITDGVRTVILYNSIHDKTKNRGFAFVEYINHRTATMARRKLIPGGIKLWDHDISVDWAEPEPEVDQEIMSKVTILYVRNLMLSTSEQAIRDAFERESDYNVTRVKKLRDFAFVHFTTREKAQVALDRLNNTQLDGSTIEVSWAKPADKNIYQKNSFSRSSSMDLTKLNGLAEHKNQGGVLSRRNSVMEHCAAGVGNADLLPIVILGQVCRMYNWSDPVYEFVSGFKTDEQGTLELVHSCKVTIQFCPGKMYTFQSPTPAQTPDVAKMIAADFVLNEMSRYVTGCDRSPFAQYPVNQDNPLPGAAVFPSYPGSLNMQGLYFPTHM